MRKTIIEICREYATQITPEHIFEGEQEKRLRVIDGKIEISELEQYLEETFGSLPPALVAERYLNEMQKAVKTKNWPEVIRFGELFVQNYDESEAADIEYVPVLSTLSRAYLDRFIRTKEKQFAEKCEKYLFKLDDKIKKALPFAGSDERMVEFQRLKLLGNLARLAEARQKHQDAINHSLEEIKANNAFNEKYSLPEHMFHDWQGRAYQRMGLSTIRAYRLNEMSVEWLNDEEIKKRFISEAQNAYNALKLAAQNFKVAQKHYQEERMKLSCMDNRANSITNRIMVEKKLASALGKKLDDKALKPLYATIADLRWTLYRERYNSQKQHTQLRKVLNTLMGIAKTKERDRYETMWNQIS